MKCFRREMNKAKEEARKRVGNKVHSRKINEKRCRKREEYIKGEKKTLKSKRSVSHMIFKGKKNEVKIHPPLKKKKKRIKICTFYSHLPLNQHSILKNVGMTNP